MDCIIMGLQRVGHNWASLTVTFYLTMLNDLLCNLLFLYTIFHKQHTQFRNRTWINSNINAFKNKSVISQYIHISNNYAVHLKIMLHVNFLDLKKVGQVKKSISRIYSIHYKLFISVLEKRTCLSSLLCYNRIILKQFSLTKFSGTMG